MKLNFRQQNILRATVRHYVSTAEPVGSKALTYGYDLQVSSATIRNVMSALEDSGLLYQPHPSAGRIPSDSGYRTYVNELMSPSKPLARQMETILSQQMGGNGRVMEALLQESAQILSSLSGYIALVTMPQVDEAQIKHVQIVRISDDQLLLVVIDTRSNHSILMSQPPAGPLVSSSEEPSEESCISDRDLQILSNFLTEQLKGKSLRDIDLAWPDIDQAFQQYAQTMTGHIQQAMGDLARRSRTSSAPQILISGLAEVLDQPEFAERSQIRSIVQLLEDGRDQLWPLISSSNPAGYSLGLDDGLRTENIIEGQRLRIWIGTENPVAPMQSCALVTATYGHAPGPVGSLGVLGPTRMLYENAVAAVEAAANYLTDAVTDTLDLSNQLNPEG
ncbi:MAG: heat-inducible transcriptional repressor HrcA [Phormidesmis sp. RL_2_1]|nr:heat-inducible transcriptional repressor HrcA [Phormidesmis sp. RL_2_1]